MKTYIAFVAFASLFSTSPYRGLQEDMAVNVPATVHARQAANLLSRAKNEVIQYMSACSIGDQQGVARTLTSDAVIEYATAEPGVYLTVDATALTTHCGGDLAPIQPGQQISNLWMFPTADEKTVFVRYDTPSSSAVQSQHLVLVEMSGDRISKIRDFTTNPRT